MLKDMMKAKTGEKSIMLTIIISMAETKHLSFKKNLIGPGFIIRKTILITGSTGC